LTELAMASFGVGQVELLDISLRVTHLDQELPGTDIDSSELKLLHEDLLGYAAPGSPDPALSPASLVMQALGPQILRGIGEEGGGPIFRTSSRL
jgi:hypothetical protein